jgi:uncharacterized membrane protein YhaH (DUF805 family)
MGLTSLYFSSTGRISRKTYWVASLTLVLLSVVTELLEEIVVTSGDAVVLSLITLLAVAIPSLMLSIKRFHDRGKSGWCMFIGFIPVLGPLWLFVELGFFGGTIGSNLFGPDPLAPMPDPGRYAVTADVR